MKIRIIWLGFITVCLFFLASMTAQGILAQEINQEGDKVTLDLFDFGPETLRAPLDAAQLTFALPANWALQDGATFQLHYIAQLDMPVTGRAVLEVTMNDVLLDTILIEDSGERVVEISVPPLALVPSRSNGRHRLNFSFNNNTDCTNNSTAKVIIQPDSHIILPHDLGVLPTDLSLLPYPLHQNSFVADDILIIVPDQPTPEELQAALSVAIGWGQQTGRNLALPLVKASDLTAPMRGSNHLILVGKPSTLPLIAQIVWPESAQGDSFDIPGIREEDGVIQMAVSPWSDAHLALLISGQNDTALVKAAQAIGADSIQPYTRSDLALISQVRKEALIDQEVAVDRTLADLGYETILVENKRRESVSIEFQIPSNSIVSDKALIELQFAHSALIDHTQSRVTMNLNDTVIGSLRLTEETVNISSASIVLPPMALRPGRNELELDMAFTPHEECNVLGNDGTWFTIYEDSLLHVPVQPVPEDIRSSFSLLDYPDPFARDVTLGETAVVLPQDDVVAWQTAAHLLLDISHQIQPPLADVIVAYAHDVPQAAREAYDIMLVGQPDSLPLLAELNELLPVGFKTDSNQLITTDLPFVFRRPANVPLGYLQMFPTDWSNGRHHVLLVSGNSEAGLQQAAHALTTTNLHNQLHGNVAIVDGDQIAIANKRLTESVTEIEATAAGDNSEVTIPTEISVSDGRPGWLLPLLIISVLALISLALGVIITAWRRRTPSDEVLHEPQ